MNAPSNMESTHFSRALCVTRLSVSHGDSHIELNIDMMNKWLSNVNYSWVVKVWKPLSHANPPSWCAISIVIYLVSPFGIPEYTYHGLGISCETFRCITKWASGPRYLVNQKYNGAIERNLFWVFLVPKGTCWNCCDQTGHAIKARNERPLEKF